jgi:hypothetical protein
VVVVDFDFDLGSDRTSADEGVKPHPCNGERNAALSAIGVSKGTFDDVLSREDRADAWRADAFGRDAARRALELSDDAEPVLTATNVLPASTTAASEAVAKTRARGRRGFGAVVKRVFIADSTLTGGAPSRKGA